VTELRVAIIGGGGFMGRAHSLAYAVAGQAVDLGGTIVKQVLVETDVTLAATAAIQLSWAESATDWREVVARPDIDVIDICTPPPLHEEIAIAAVRAGKHVFCEKPITNDAAQAERMAVEAAAAGVVTQVGFNYRHTSAIGQAKRLLDSGRLGEPLQLRATYLQGAAFAADPNRWRARRATGGSGMVGDIGSHVIDMAELLFGPIDRVSALVRTKGPGDTGWVPETQRHAEDLVDDAGVWIAEFANGALGSFAVNAFASGRMNQVALSFDATKGAVDFDWNRREEFRVSFVDEAADEQGFRTIHTNDQHPDGFWRLAGLGTGYVEVSATQFQHFFRAITGQGSAAPDFAAGARVQRIVEAVHRSATDGGWVSVADQQVSGR
jgi:predicted dehydrogenase